MPSNSPIVPSQAAELSLLRPLLPLIWEALEIGTTNATKHFKDYKGKFSPYLFANLVRWHAGVFLQDKGYVLEEFEHEDMAADGLCLVYRKRRLRIWKAIEGELPAPGRSSIKKDFYNQKVRNPQLIPIDEECPVDLNLAILWNADSRHRLAALHLACPRWASHDGFKAGAWWTIQLDHPATATAGATGQSVVPSERDLPIHLKEEPQVQVENAE